MKERPILMSPPMAKAAYDGTKTMTRRVVKPQPRYEKGTIAPQELRGEPKRHPAPYFDCYCSQRKATENPRGMSEFWCWWDEYDRQGNDWIKCPYGVPGDQLWVKESWVVGDHDFAKPHPSAWLLEMPGVKDTKELHACWWASPPEEEREMWASRFGTADTHGGTDTKVRPSIFMPRWASRTLLEITEIRAERLNEISSADCEAEGMSSLLDLSKEWKDTRRANETQYQAMFRELWERINGPGSWGPVWVWVVGFRRVGVN